MQQNGCDKGDLTFIRILMHSYLEVLLGVGFCPFPV